MVLFHYFLFIIFATFSTKHALAKDMSDGEIIHTNKFILVKKDIEQVDHNTLVIFDVDKVLVKLSDEDIARLPYINNLKDKHSKEEVARLESIFMRDAKWDLVDKDVISIFNILEKRKIPSIALTLLRTGKYGVIDKVEIWRVNQLKKLGIDFTNLTPFKDHIIESEFKGEYGTPILIKGVLLSAMAGKAEVLEKIFQKTGYYPKKIIFIDDHLPHLESMQKLCQKLKIKFRGFHYVYDGETTSAKLHK